MLIMVIHGKMHKSIERNLISRNRIAPPQLSFLVVYVWRKCRHRGEEHVAAHSSIPQSFMDC